MAGNLELERQTAAAGKILVRTSAGLSAIRATACQMAFEEGRRRRSASLRRGGICKAGPGFPVWESSRREPRSRSDLPIPRSRASWRAQQAARGLTLARSPNCFRFEARTTPSSSGRRTCCASDCVGDTVRYVVNRNINYTNICYFKCKLLRLLEGQEARGICADKPYDLAFERNRSPSQEAWDRGATEVCLQGGIHPDYDGNTYIGIVSAIRQAVPEIHIHAFSPLEDHARRRDPRHCGEGLSSAPQGGRPGLAAGHRRGDSGRRRSGGSLPRQVKLRAMARNGRDIASSRSADDGHDHVRSYGTLPSTGRGTFWRFAICRRAPADSPNSYRFRLFIWKRQ